jgi:outer membrane receptor protein involved in Fe transport
VSSGYAERETYDDNELLIQNSSEEDDDLEHNLNYGASYTFGKNRLSYEGVFNSEDEEEVEFIRTKTSNLNSGDLITQYIRQTTQTENNYSLDNALVYERLYDNDERELRASVSYSFRDQIEEEDIEVFNGIYNINDISRPANSLQRSIGDEYRGTGVIQFDYRFPALTGELETGYKTTYRSFDNDFDYEIYNDGDGKWVNQENVSNRFLYEEQVHAAYVIYNKEIGDLSLSVGTRAEQTLVDTRLFDTNEENDQNYLQLFPSVQTAWKFNDHNTLRATYSRRIDRPRAWHLNPFPDVSDSLNIRIGDPNLQPEYINSFELGHMFDKGLFNLTTTAFYRRTDNQIDWIVRVEDGISYRGPQNLLTRDVYGVEIIATAEIASWWQVNTSFSYFGVQVDGTNLDDSFTNSGQAWYAKMNSDFYLPWGINLQLTGNYTSPEIEAQGRDLARYYIDASLQKNFMDKKFQLSLSLRDIFNTRNFQGENFGPDFRQTFEWKWETQVFLASLAYTFGGYKDKGRGDRRRR